MSALGGYLIGKKLNWVTPICLIVIMITFGKRSTILLETFDRKCISITGMNKLKNITDSVKGQSKVFYHIKDLRTWLNDYPVPSAGFHFLRAISQWDREKK